MVSDADDLAELIDACRAGTDEIPWREFVRRVQPLIAGTVIRSCRSWQTPTPDLVDDLVQDTFVRICAKDRRVLREFVAEHPESIFGLIKTIAFSVVQDHFKKILSQSKGGGMVAAPLNEAITPQGETAQDLERKILISEIGELFGREGVPERERSIFWLFYRDGMTARAIAEIPALQLGEKGVDSVLTRLKTLLKEKFVKTATEKGKAQGSSF